MNTCETWVIKSLSPCLSVFLSLDRRRRDKQNVDKNITINIQLNIGRGGLQRSSHGGLAGWLAGDGVEMRKVLL